MISEKNRTAEFVSPKHPDKICDFIADSILDGYLSKDPKARCALEVMGGHGVVTVTGEIKSAAKVDIKKIVQNIIGEEYEVRINTAEQSPEIAHGVDSGGAGDQGIMVGYAVNETKNLMPPEYELARTLCKKVYDVYSCDGKVQVTIQDKNVETVVASFQNTKTKELEKLVRGTVRAEKYIINPAGEWRTGGFEADSGLSGRKLAVDSYGPNVPVGGGSFSGKDPTKVDRSGAYMARKIAVDYVKNASATEVLVKLAYAIGIPEPVMAVVFIDGKEEKILGYDLTPKGIINKLILSRPIYAQTAQWGHFGRGFKWDD